MLGVLHSVYPVFEVRIDVEKILEKIGKKIV